MTDDRPCRRIPTGVLKKSAAAGYLTAQENRLLVPTPFFKPGPNP
jgi:hypothetical protein